MAGIFDDLIPAKPATGGAFDDLIPAAPPLAAQQADYLGRTTAFERFGDRLGQGVAQARMAGAAPALMAANFLDSVDSGPMDRLTAPPSLADALNPLGRIGESALAGVLDLFGVDTQPAQRALVDSATRQLVPLQAEIAAIPKAPASTAALGAESVGDFFSALSVDPLGVAADVAVPSAVGQAPALALGALTRNPAAAAGVAGASSYGAERGAGVLDYLSRQGIDTTNPQAVDAALADPAVLRAAQDFAATRAGIIAPVDAAGLGIAGKTIAPFVKGQAAREAVSTLAGQPLVQALLGMGGETAAQGITTGELKAGDILAEGLGELAMSPAETLPYVAERVLSRPPSAPAAPAEPLVARQAAPPAGADLASVLASIPPETVADLAAALPGLGEALGVPSPASTPPEKVVERPASAPAAAQPQTAPLRQSLPVEPQNPRGSAPATLADALALDEDAYIAAVNPEGKRISPDDRVRVFASDLDTPADAQPAGQFTDSTGAPVELLRTPAGLFAQIDGKTVGSIELEDGETLNTVAEDFQGRGIGTLLAREFIRENPLAPSGGFSEAGEATRRKAFRQLREEASNAAPAAAPVPGVSAGRDAVPAPAAAQGAADAALDPGPALYELSAAELDAYMADDDARAEATERRVLGERRDAWRSAQRRQNSMDPARAEAASAELAEIEARLSPRDRDSLYGVGDTAPTAEDARDFRTAMVDAENVANEAEAAERMGFHMSKLGGTEGSDPSGWSRDEQIAYGAMRALRDRIGAEGWDTAAIGRAALNRAASRFDSRENAEFMLSRFLKPRQQEPELARLPRETLPDQGPARLPQDRAGEPAGLPERAPGEAPQGSAAGAPQAQGARARDVAPDPKATGTKNAARDRERQERGADPILRAAAKSNETTLAEGQAALDENPAFAREVVEKLNTQGTPSISPREEAALLVEKVRLRKARDAAADRAADPQASEEARAVASREWETLEGQLNEIDQATSASGREWGRFGQFRQRMLREDFTFEALERKERVREGRPLTAEESASLRAFADRVKALEDRVSDTERQLQEAAAREGVTLTYKKLVEDMAKAMPKRQSAATIRKNAAESLKALRGGVGSRPRDGQGRFEAFPIGMADSDVERAIRPLVRDWRGDAPAVRVVQEADALPEGAKFGRDWQTVEGWYDGRGTVWLVASNLRDKARVLEVLAHEAIGHYGVEGVLGREGWQRMLDDVGRLRARRADLKPELRAALDDTMQRYGDADPITFARELLAVMAERGVKAGIIDRVLAAVRDFLRKLGFPVERWADATLRTLVADGARRVQRAGASPNMARERGAAASQPPPKSLAERRARREANVPPALVEARDAADARFKAATAAMDVFPKSAIGLTSDAAKATPEWQAAKRELDAAQAAAQRASAAVVKAARSPGGAYSRPAVDPIEFFHLSMVGTVPILDGVTEREAWMQRMRADLGDEIFSRVESALPDVFDAASIQAQGVNERAIDPENVRHADVYALARKAVNDGVRGETAVMQRVVADLKAAGADLDERQVRRLFSEYGKVAFPSKEADKVLLRELRSLVQMQESIDRITEGLAALKSGPQRDKQTQLVREKRRALNDLLKQHAKTYRNDPEKLATFQQARVRNLQNQIEDLEKQIATGERPKRAKPPDPTPEVQALIAQRDQLRRERDLIDNPKATPDERYQRTQAKNIARQLADVQARLAAGDYERRPRVPKELNEANTAAKVALQKIKAEFARRQFEAEMAKRPLVRRIFAGAGEALNLSRAYLTSLDFSGLLRQGGFITLGHPVRAAKAVPQMLRAFASEGGALNAREEIASRPNAALYKKHKLELTTDDPGTSITKMEEQFASRWLERVPQWALGGLVRGSARAYSTVLNRIRADAFDAMSAALSRSKVPTKEEGDAIANYINVATGRGWIGRSNLGAQGLNTVFFAPRLVASRFNLLAFQPLYGGTPRTRAMILAEYARFLMGVSVVFALAHLAADEDDDEPLVTLDPRSSNFAKIKFNNTYIDPLAGLAQVTTFLSRVTTGETVTGAGEVKPLRNTYRLSDFYADEPLPEVAFGDGDTFDVMARFARTKFAPVPSAVTTALAGENVIGEPATPGDTVVSLVVPIGFQDVLELMTDNELPKAAGTFLLSLLGFGVQYRKPSLATMQNRLKDVASEDLPEEVAALRERYPDAFEGRDLDTYADNPQNRRLGRAGEPKRDPLGRPRFDKPSE